MLNVACSPDPALIKLLGSHPRVASVVETNGEAALAWSQGTWRRAVYVDRADIDLRGIIELTDNNPLVCADAFSLPSPSATLAVIALGPLAEAGLIVERPTMLINVETDEEEINPFLEPLGWKDGLTVASDPIELAGTIAATVICAVSTPDRIDDLDDLFDERYGRSFFVRREEAKDWDVQLVAGNTFAVYRLRIAQDEPTSLLTIQLLADRNGKCGAAQIVHAMNVMAGFEESLGLE